MRLIGSKNPCSSHIARIQSSLRFNESKVENDHCTDCTRVTSLIKVEVYDQ